MTWKAVSETRLREREKRLGAFFCEDGQYAEMGRSLSSYTEKTAPIEGVSFGWYGESIDRLKDAVLRVEEKWCRYFDGAARVFCAYADGEIVSFCIVEEDADCLLSDSFHKVGSIGCVGTLPEYRGRGIGLRLVDLATVLLKKAGCEAAYIGYTHLDFWYERLGYQVVARFSLTR